MSFRDTSKTGYSSYSDEYYTGRAQVIDVIGRVSLDKSWRILCPFDSAESEFVKYLTEQGYNVTHLKEGQRNTDYNPENFDIIITNPPWRSFIKLYSDYFDRAPRFIAILSWTVLFNIEKRTNRKIVQARNFGTGKLRSAERTIQFEATNSDKAIGCFYLYKGFDSGNNLVPVKPL
jgi:hypothetical protein